MSEGTADLLIMTGLDNWVVPRETMIEAKGECPIFAELCRKGSRFIPLLNIVDRLLLSQAKGNFRPSGWLPKSIFPSRPNHMKAVLTVTVEQVRWPTRKMTKTGLR